MPRRFSKRQRSSLYLASGGRCEVCRAVLPAGWHADHVVPWSKGGETEVENGQALCPSCNLKKGSTMNEMRPWQRKALHSFVNSDRTDFLVVATPGAGKTRLSLECMAGAGEFFVIVVPTSRLRIQWADAAAPYNIRLDPNFENSMADPADDVHGVVVTYQAVQAAPHVYRRLTSLRSAFVVLDEVHHCGDEMSWGDSIQYAFEGASRRLLLSGTPFRKDSNPIPFVRYEGDPPKSKADVSYGYQLALRDGAVRSVEFALWTGRAKWVNQARDIEERDLSAVAKLDEGRALTSALMVESDWMGTALPEAHETLSRIRRDVPDAGGLIVSHTQHHARAVAAKMSKIVGREVPVAVSDDPKARDIIENFTRSSDPWLVAVNMVSEGVDIPRLMVGVYATLSRTELFFRQVVGRFVRTRGDESDSYPATVFLPSVPSLVALARDIEEERDHTLKIMEDREREQKDGSDQQVFDLVEPLAAIDGRHLATILRGDELTDEELRRADELIAQAALGGVSPAQVARLLRMAGLGRVAGRVTVEARPDYLDKEALRKDVSNLVGKVAWRTGEQHSIVWRRLHDAIGRDKITQYTTDEMRAAVGVLARWLDEA